MATDTGLGETQTKGQATVERQLRKKTKTQKIRVYNYVHKKLGFGRLMARKEIMWLKGQCRRGVGVGRGVFVCIHCFCESVSQHTIGVYTKIIQLELANESFPRETSEGLWEIF